MDFSKTRKSPILLQEVNRKYALDSLRPMRGFVRLENNADRGLVTVIVENIKFFPEGGYVYKLLFAGVRRERTMYHLLGSLSEPAAGGGRVPAAGDQKSRPLTSNEHQTTGGRMEGRFTIEQGKVKGGGRWRWDIDKVIVAVRSISRSRSIRSCRGNSRSPALQDRTAPPPRRITARFTMISCWSAASPSPESSDSLPIFDHLPATPHLPTGRRF